MKLGIIVGTTRQGRQSLKMAKWVYETAVADGAEAELIDLAAYPMEFFPEAVSPRFNPNREVPADAKPWLDKLAQQDAYVFVTPEYNHSIPGVLKNALDYVTWEMNRKPAAIVSHGTVGGARAAMHLKEILSESKTVPIPNFVAFAGMSDQIDDEGKLDGAVRAKPYGPQSALESLLAELQWYGEALGAARQTGTLAAGS